ncbi:hypothetical protein O7623_13730 [Solwaraspora sp. WMMD791]|uniref:hypothetical protein n=1 Tax=Solwaraspora sp. WMMD791 TaxID=3016086 RepID=UPI00249A9D3F|nr:hypothetical protein [Solwaraspora sp. WMMD791]WFE30173.1 hypothetical protein O7623_13730 [Solwaraspora sp. WMMD791]
MPPPDVELDPEALLGHALLLHDLAQNLQGSQFDLFLLDWAAAPASHPQVAAKMRMFCEFARLSADQRPA